MKPSGFDTRREAAGIETRLLELSYCQNSTVNRVKNSPLCSYQDVAKVLGISPTRVFQIEQRALGKLRKAFKKIGITSMKCPSVD